MIRKLSVVIITYNEENNILRCINSVKNLADEIIVVDSFSTDRTVEICNSSGCKVILHKFEGYGQQKQFGVDQAENDWILSLDADEEVTDELVQEIKALLNKEIIPHGGYYIPFAFFYLGRVLKHVGVGNLRLFDRTKGKFRIVAVHESVDVNGPVGKLKGKVIHYSYRDLAHHLQKLNTYTSQAAEGYISQGRKFSKVWVFFKFPINFLNFYFIRLGILNGYPGFIWSFFAAIYGSVKVAKTIEMQEKK
ncbi:MAG: glycosyltransferase family 2 protein [Bacteroidales bacterium]|jgi:glycosyltransferase involved in cell wall biosynthesis